MSNNPKPKLVVMPKRPVRKIDAVWIGDENEGRTIPHTFEIAHFRTFGLGRFCCLGQTSVGAAGHLRR